MRITLVANRVPLFLVSCRQHLCFVTQIMGNFNVRKLHMHFLSPAKKENPVFVLGALWTLFNSNWKLSPPKLLPAPTLSCEFFELICQQKNYIPVGQKTNQSLVAPLLFRMQHLKKLLQDAPWDVLQENVHIVPVFTTQKAFCEGQTDFGYGTRVSLLHPQVLSSCLKSFPKKRGTDKLFDWSCSRRAAIGIGEPLTREEPS